MRTHASAGFRWWNLPPPLPAFSPQDLYRATAVIECLPVLPPHVTPTPRAACVYDLNLVLPFLCSWSACFYRLLSPPYRHMDFGVLLLVMVNNAVACLYRRTNVPATMPPAIAVERCCSHHWIFYR